MGDFMKVISGIYKGRKLKGYDVIGTRPTSSRVKESVFGMIQNKVKESVCLDLFAGSGSLGIEALSNGAKSVYFVDNNPKLIKVLKENLNSLNLENVEVYTKSYEEALKNFKNEKIKFDLVFLDPPYGKNLIENILKLLVDYNILNEGAYVVCEDSSFPNIKEPFNTLKQREYGYKKVTIVEFSTVYKD